MYAHLYNNVLVDYTCVLIRRQRPDGSAWSERFALDPRGAGRAERWWTTGLPGTAEMPVPASFNDILGTREARDHVGDVWYQRTVHVPRGWEGQRIVLRFDAATHRATVWVGDVQVVEHEGGYTPFEVDVTELVRAGEAAQVSVVVNNELSWTSIPPGLDRVPALRGNTGDCLAPGCCGRSRARLPQTPR